VARQMPDGAGSLTIMLCDHAPASNPVALRKSRSVDMCRAVVLLQYSGGIRAIEILPESRSYNEPVEWSKFPRHFNRSGRSSFSVAKV
jgi:hypothetical protein